MEAPARDYTRKRCASAKKRKHPIPSVTNVRSTLERAHRLGAGIVRPEGGDVGRHYRGDGGVGPLHEQDAERHRACPIVAVPA